MRHLQNNEDMLYEELDNENEHKYRKNKIYEPLNQVHNV